MSVASIYSSGHRGGVERIGDVVSRWQEIVDLRGRNCSGTNSENSKEVVVEPSLPRKSGFTVGEGVATFFGWKKLEAKNAVEAK
jgi:hypothetical protein